MAGIVENITPFMMTWDELDKLCRANGVKPMRKMHCNNCGKGHHKHQYPDIVPCAQCKQFGHFKRDCPSSKKK
jgi:hypothetical protein